MSMTRRIAAIDGSGRWFEFVCEGDDSPDVLHLIQSLEPSPLRGHRARYADRVARSRDFGRRYREYRRRAEEER